MGLGFRGKVWGLRPQSLGIEDSGFRVEGLGS